MTITWTPRADNPFVLDGKPGGYLIEIFRARSGRRRGQVVSCRVWHGDIISFGKPSLAEAKAFAERHAASKRAKQGAK